MQKEQIRNQLKKQLFENQGLRQKKSIDIENNITQQNSPQLQETFQDAYQLMEKIGEGAHSVVRKCLRLPKQKSARSLMTKSTQIYAVKCFRTDDPEIVNTIIQTFNLQRLLQDVPRICRAYDLFIDEKTKHQYQVIEYCDIPSLDQVFPLLSLKHKQETIKQLAQTIAQIHSKGICHRDLKPENILIQLNPEIQIKLIDFGVSKRFKFKDTFKDMWTATGTIVYQAPEVFLGGGYDEKVDIWSIGVILYQLLCYRLPFFADTVSETIELITSENLSFQYTEEFQNLSYIERDLIKRLLKHNPHHRLYAEDISLHPWFEDQSIHTQYVISDDTNLMSRQILEERTLSTQIGNEISDQQVQNLMDSFEWGQRIHFKK
ncbi:unnamed protein product (macronuclear) [Paramecium tetraurelia]|uniref:Protein kinase domain-containing protein n=1 Tax=Paramecium tetraurelia TaxID=5888 RepID=A0DZD0_PARTE|nr:uncharacterized protein GSPATT00003366001 [Paramecium tetraurelia]CAK88397.1 unnamed protein product [Paramecium tetraurelia]|eukprot:XP_001455794.1 hypothetical protein (macronuclear) [Paramecium tetraurelia strain d4-2]